MPAERIASAICCSGGSGLTSGGGVNPPEKRCEMLAIINSCAVFACWRDIDLCLHFEKSQWLIFLMWRCFFWFFSKKKC
jgi:hypothetical protein